MSPRDEYADDLTLRAARERYFERNGFGADGGYHKKFEVVKLGPIPLVIPNPPGRRKALRFHDLHHVLTGYKTDLAGEFEISAFELGAGCGRLWFAWLINLTGIGAALLRPRTGAAAWARGRASGGLYHRPFSEALLDRRVGEMRRELALDGEVPAGPRDWFAFVTTAVFGLFVGGAVYLGPPAAIVGAIVWALG